MDHAIKYFESIPRLERNQVLPIVAISTALLYTSYRLLYSSSKTKQVQGHKSIPVPDCTYPYVGHMFSLGALPSRTIAAWHKELGPIIKLHMGAITWVTISDPVLAHKIFVTHGAETSYRPHSTFAYDYYSDRGKGIGFAQPGAGWKEIRSAVMSVLGPKQVEKYMDLIQQQAGDLVLRMLDSSQKEDGINPHYYFSMYSLNVISSVCMGKQFDSVNDPAFIQLVDTLADAMKFAGLENDLPNFLPAISFIDYFTGIKGKMRDFIKHKRDPISTEFVREAYVSSRPNMIKSFKENGYDIPEEDMIVLLFDLLGGGTDTILITLCWNIAIMCNYPQVQNIASDEIDAFIKLNGRIPQFREREQVPYCISVLKECMRFKPTTAFGIPHAVYDDVEVDGYIIPKGSTVVPSMESMHVDPDFYPEPYQFLPERFMNNLKTMDASSHGKVTERDHFNFGWGRRVCPAAHLAEAEIFTAFIQIFSRCKVEPVLNQMPDIDTPVSAGINLSPSPYKVKFIPRVDALI
ncbi:hypothetical protein HPULCUR_011384 [Helicostylum pulchrum]|uniref:Cytochrome P450 n=1 Tax=Helicostylum pulchrum TaxID=562976 RepID=A0ABP9YFY3_9FUNG